MTTNIYRGSKQATFPWEIFLSEHPVHTSDVIFLIDETEVQETPDVLTIAVSEDFEENKFFDNLWIIKARPQLFFEFQNGHINRNRMLDQLRSMNKTYIAPNMDSVYELAYLVKDLTSGVKYQVQGMDKPDIFYNPCRFEKPVSPLQKDVSYRTMFFAQLRMMGQNFQSLVHEQPGIYGFYNLANIVLTFVVLTFHIYTSENKSLYDSFYSNRSLRFLVLSKMDEVYHRYFK